jgi:hypothetical protein
MIPVRSIWPRSSARIPWWIVQYEGSLVTDRDRSIDQLLRQSRPPAAATTVSCLEPETIAAWLDGTLSANDRTAAEAHAAACDRCQAIVAATMSSEPPAVKETSLRTPFIRWVAPLALATAALLAWMIVAPPSRQLPAAPVADTAPAIARFEAPAEPSVAAPAAREQPKVEANRRRLEPEGAEANAKERLRDERAASVAAPPPAIAPSAPLTARQPSELAQLEKRADHDAKANADTAAGPKLEATPRKPEQAMRETAAIAPPVLSIASPDPAVRWRVTSPGRVERSVDGGVTWTPQDVGEAVTIRAGRSVSTDVAWLVGNDGVVLVTSDGRTWQRRNIGEAVALVDVTPTDARTATVTAADGRRFTTRDGGATWIRATPQENPAAPF